MESSALHSTQKLVECLVNLKPPQQDYAMLVSALHDAREAFTVPIDNIIAQYFLLLGNGYAFWQQSYDYPRVHEYFFSAYLGAKESLNTTSINDLREEQRTSLDEIFRCISLALIHNTDCENSLITNSQLGLRENATNASRYMTLALEALEDLDLGDEPAYSANEHIKPIIHIFLKMHQLYFDALAMCAEMYLIPWGELISDASLEEKRRAIEDLLEKVKPFSRELHSELRAHFGMAHRGAVAYQRQEGTSLRIKQADLTIRAIGYAGRDLINALFDQFRRDDSAEPLRDFAREQSGLQVSMVRSAGYLNEAYETATGIERLDRLILELPAGTEGITVTTTDGNLETPYQTSGFRVSITRFGSIAVDFEFCIGDCDEDSEGMSGASVSHMRVLEALLGPHMGQFDYGWGAPPEEQADKPFFRPESSNFVRYFLKAEAWLQRANELLEARELADSESAQLRTIEEALEDWKRNLLELGEKLQNPTRERPYRFDPVLGTYSYTLEQRNDLQQSFSHMREIFQDSEWSWLHTGNSSDSPEVAKLRRDGLDLFPNGRIYVKLMDVAEEIMRRVRVFLEENAKRQTPPINVSHDDIHTRIWVDRNTGWHATLVCNRMALRYSDGKEIEPFTQEEHFAILNHPQFKGLTLQDREARAGLDDWQFSEQPEYRTNLGKVRSHNTDAVYAGPNTVLVYLPDDPQFIVVQYVVNSRLIGDLRTIMLAHQTHSKELIRKLETILDQIDTSEQWKPQIEQLKKRDEFMDLSRDWESLNKFIASEENEDSRAKFVEGLRAQIRITTRQIGRTMDLVRDSSLTKYEDHGELLRGMIRATKLDSLSNALQDSSDTLDRIYANLSELV